MIKLWKSCLTAVAAPALAAAALAGPGAGAAQACQNVQGTGTSVQATAHAAWTVAFTNGCFASYAPNDLAAPNAWHADGTTPWVNWEYLAVDAAPTAAQIANVNASVAAGGSGASVKTIPVAQVAIAILVNPPSGCSISTVTAAQLESAFRGASTTWASIGATGTCSSAITRVVPADPSGITYHLKHHLFTINNAVVAGTNTWAGLQAPSLNTTWPGTTLASRLNGTGPVGSGVGGADEARTVATTTGSIGFAALPQARAVYDRRRSPT